LNAEANAIEAAITSALAGGTRTADIAETGVVNASTAEMVDRIVSALHEVE
jgi:isocitrate/isopropylmalate dehydrogenase